MESLQPEQKLTIDRGNVDVVGLDPKIKRISLLVHVKCKKEEFDNADPRIKAMINCSVKRATQYLISEGFLPKNPGDWNVEINVIGHADEKNLFPPHDGEDYDSGCAL